MLRTEAADTCASQTLWVNVCVLEPRMALVWLLGLPQVCCSPMQQGVVLISASALPLHGKEPAMLDTLVYFCGQVTPHSTLLPLKLRPDHLLS